MNLFNYESFKERLLDALKKSYTELIKLIDEKEIVGFAVFSDDSARSIGIIYETEKHLKQKNEENPDDMLYYKWYQDEWDGEISNAEIQSLSKSLFIIEHDNENEFLKHRNKIFDIIVKTLINLRQNNFFINTNHEFILKFGISDFDNPEIEIEWVEKLNSIKNYKEFKEWRMSW